MTVLYYCIIVLLQPLWVSDLSKHICRKVNSRCFRWLLAAILVDHGRSTNVAALCEMLREIDNSETMYHTDLRIGETVYIFVLTSFQVVGFFYWTVLNLLFVAWQWKQSKHAHIAQYCFDNTVAFVCHSIENSYVFAFFVCHSSWTKYICTCFSFCLCIGNNLSYWSHDKKCNLRP